MNNIREQIAEAHAAVVATKCVFDGVKAAMDRMREVGAAADDGRLSQMQEEWSIAAAAYSDAISNHAAVIEAAFPIRRKLHKRR